MAYKTNGDFLILFYLNGTHTVYFRNLHFLINLINAFLNGFSEWNYLNIFDIYFHFKHYV